MLSSRLRNVESWDEGLNGVMLLQLTVEILAILRLTVNPKWNIVVRNDFFALSIKKHFYLSNAKELFPELKRKKFATYRIIGMTI